MCICFRMADIKLYAVAFVTATSLFILILSVKWVAFSPFTLRKPAVNRFAGAKEKRTFGHRLRSANESISGNDRNNQDEMKLLLQTSLQQASKEKVGGAKFKELGIYFAKGPHTSYLSETVIF